MDMQKYENTLVFQWMLTSSAFIEILKQVQNNYN